MAVIPLPDPPQDRAAAAGLILGAVGLMLAGIAAGLLALALRPGRLEALHGEPVGALYLGGRFYCVDDQARTWPSRGECD